MKSRTVIARIALAFVILGAIWSVSVAVTGGFLFSIGGRAFSSREPMRPLYWTLLPLALFVWLNGVERTARAWSSALRRIDHRWAAAALTVMTFVLGTAYATTAVGGSDAYGYVSEADLWLRSDLRLPQPWVEKAPWPDAARTFSPLAYRPAGTGNPTDIVPVYSPGLPLLMAAAKRVGGHGALFLIVPLAGALLVLTTWGIGRRLGSSAAGLIAALFVASSPAFLFMLMTPMSDVPAAACWAISFYFLLRPSVPSGSLAGLAAGLAVLIRPNVIWIAVPIALWLIWHAARSPRDARGKAIARLMGFSFGVSAGALFIGAVNAKLYGSPLQSGYGALGPLFGWSNVPINARHYLEWLVSSQTLFIILGLVAAVWPWRKIWPTVTDRSFLWLTSATVIGIWLFYCFYLPFDEWWFLRFLLISWPFIMLGLGAVLVAFSRGRAIGLVLSTCLVFVLGIREFNDSRVRGAFELWQGDREFVVAAQLTRAAIPPSSVVLSELHSGSLRYYGGCMTLEYSWLDRAWLDRAVAWLGDHGAPAYALLAPGEVKAFKARFAGSTILSRLDARPIIDFFDSGLALYALSAPFEGQTQTIRYEPKQFRSVPPVELRPFDLR
jgi:hypothetical protein